MANLKHFVPTDIMLGIYKTYALPLFDYADVIYHSANEDCLALLQRVQNRCIKYCLKVPMGTSTNVIHVTSNLPKLLDKRVYHLQIYGFKKAQITKYTDIRPRQTRAATAPLLKYSHVILSSYEHSLEVVTAQTWNALRPEYRNIKEILKFKNTMKSLLNYKVEAYKD